MSNHIMLQFWPPFNLHPALGPFDGTHPLARGGTSSPQTVSFEEYGPLPAEWILNGMAPLFHMAPKPRKAAIPARTPID